MNRTATAAAGVQRAFAAGGCVSAQPDVAVESDFGYDKLSCAAHMHTLTA